MKPIHSLLALATLGLTGCATTRDLDHDHARCFNQVLTIQADLGRPTVANAAYTLTGFEGLELRKRVTEESTDKESGQVEATKTIGVQ